MNICDVVEEGCEEKVYAKGKCERHYTRIRKRGTYKARVKACVWPACSSTDVAARRLENRLCPEHFDIAYLDSNTPITHRHLSTYGYVIVTVLGKPTREHRLVMERHLNRRLLPGENVHHVDGNRTNNTLENLELWSEDQPPGQRVSDKITWALSIIEKYGANASAF